MACALLLRIVAMGRRRRRDGMKTNSEPGAYLALDGMRGVGAMVVVVAHCYIFWAGLSFPNGFPVVDMFFLLSGFVIAFAYEPRFHSGMTVGKFMLQRLVRLYPLYILGIAMGAVVHFLIVADSSATTMGAYAGALIPQLLMLPSPDITGTGDFYHFNVPAWTLFFEFAANLVYILCWRWLKSTRVLAVVVGLSAIWLAWAVLSAGTVDLGPMWHDFSGGFARVAFSFFGGVLMFRLVGSPKAIKTRITLWAILPAALLPIVVLPDAGEFRPWLDLFTVIVISPAFVWLAQATNPPRWLWRVFATLGGMSYAMYILHYPIFVAAKRLSFKVPELSTVWAPWSGIAILAIVFVISVAAERLYDEPVRAWISGKLKARDKRRKAQQAAAAVAAE
jgi:peptidoglycan/LPS O-acetylase OafA/YrhL